MDAEEARPTGHTALLIVDMQNGFCHAEGSFARMGVDVTPFATVVGPCLNLLEAARQAAAPIVFFRYVYREDYADHGTLFRHTIADMKREKSLIAGTWDVDIVDQLAPRPGERVVDKNRPSGFFGNDLATTLREEGVRSVIVCGVTTSCCVEGTVRDAGQHDFKTVVVSDATAEMTEDRHNAALHTLGFLFAEVLTTAEAERHFQ